MERPNRHILIRSRTAQPCQIAIHTGTMANLSEKLQELEASGRSINVGLIGAGKFGSMFISQAHTTPGIRLAAVADLSIDRAHDAFKRTEYPNTSIDLTRSLSISEGIRQRKTVVTTDSAELIAHPDIDVIVEATGSPAAGVRHTLLCCEHKKHIVMVNVEADVLAGPLLAQKAKEAGIIYSWAYGDQPALIAELVDWATTSGFKVVCAGKGNKFLPEYNYSTPDTVWDHWVRNSSVPLSLLASIDVTRASPKSNWLQTTSTAKFTTASSTAPSRRWRWLRS